MDSESFRPRTALAEATCQAPESEGDYAETWLRNMAGRDKSPTRRLLQPALNLARSPALAAFSMPMSLPTPTRLMPMSR